MVTKDQLKQIQSSDTPLSLIMFDLDHFKKINDQYGHDVGDQVLIDLTKLIKCHLREQDSIGRYGGEEFIVVLPNTPLESAKIIAQRLRQEIADYAFDKVGQVTVSMGLVQAYQNEAQKDLLKRADILLYEAKERGRNQVVDS